MTINLATARERLRKFEFAPLFIEDMGWDHCRQSFDVKVADRAFKLTAVAKKCGLVAFACSSSEDNGRLPDRALRLAIDREVTHTNYEHLLVFTDAAQTTQIWQWVRREPGRPIACREHIYHPAQPGDSLLQKLQQLAVSLDEEERGVTLPDITSRVRAAFDVERVTKRFYEQFRKEKDVFTKFIEGIPVQKDQHWYASVMLNRLMFVYFFQRKGFLNGESDYLRNRLAQMNREHGKDKFYSFYRHFLLRLFHEGLGQRPPRKAGLDKLLGRIPYLNGGIFDVHTLEAKDNYGPKIQIPDKAFERIFDYFDQYAWHLDERPLSADNEINPAVLGFIFEKYVNQKQMGAYYTQEDITEYITKSTIIPFLFDAARARCKVAFDNPTGSTVWDLLKTDPDRYIYPAVRRGVAKPLPKEIADGLDTSKPNLIERRKAWNKPAPSDYALPTEIWREVVARRQHCENVRARLAAGEIRDINDFITLNLDLRQFAQDVIVNCEGPDLLMAFWQGIANLTVLDPTGGSGAFLFAALNILEPLYGACLDRMEAFLAEWGESGKKLHPNYHKKFTEVLARVARHPNRRYFVLKSIVVNNLYAVDIMEEAVEICKLRLFLKLAAQVEPDPAEDNLGIEPLPDIDFNIRAGNTLVGYATAEEVRKCLTSEKTSGHDQMRLGVMGEKDAYAVFEDKLQIADAAFRSFREQQTELGGAVTAEDKAMLKSRLKSLEDELNRHLATEYGVKVSDKAAYDNWLKSHQPFHWFIQFYGILNGGGFDVIIGNPPYVELSDIAGQYSVRHPLLVETGNLYALCLERFTQLFHATARLGVIVPISSISTPRMLPLMQMLHRRLSPLHLSNFAVRPGKLFVGVDMNLTIIIGRRAQKAQTDAIFATAYNRWNECARNVLFANLAYAPAELIESSSAITKSGNTLSARLFRKIAQHPSLARQRSEAPSADIVYYHSGGRYFRKCIREQLSNEYKPLNLQKGFANPAVCLLSSSLYYWFWITISDCYHVTKRDIDSMLVPKSLAASSEMTELAARLLKDLWKHAERRIRNRKDGSQQEEVNFRVGMSKPIIDEIDTALAQHYEFSAEELDFIMNYDWKYRFGESGREQE